MSEDDLLTPAQVAEKLGVSEITLKRMRLKGEGPPAVFLSARTIRYRPGAVREWMIQNQTKAGPATTKG